MIKALALSLPEYLKTLRGYMPGDIDPSGNQLDRLMLDQVNQADAQLEFDVKGKKLEVVESDGLVFVRRSYEQSTLDNVRQLTGVSFDEAWQAMHQMYQTAGLEIVPSRVFHDDTLPTRYPTVVVSEYLRDAVPVEEAPLEATLQLAYSLGRLVPLADRFIPSMQMMKPDWIRAVPDPAGGTRMVVIDVDPLVVEKPTTRVVADEQFATYSKRVRRLFGKNWCASRQELAQAAYYFTQGQTNAMKIAQMDPALFPDTIDEAANWDALRVGYPTEYTFPPLHPSSDA